MTGESCMFWHKTILIVSEPHLINQFQQQNEELEVQCTDDEGKRLIKICLFKT